METNGYPLVCPHAELSNIPTRSPKQNVGRMMLVCAAVQMKRGKDDEEGREKN